MESFRMLSIGGIEMKRISLIPLCLMLLGLMALGCSSNWAASSQITTIETVLTEMFTGPDSKWIRLLEDPANLTIIREGETTSPESPTELDLYLAEIYKPHFTESMYEQFVGAYAMNYQVSAYYNHYKINAESIDLTRNDSTDAAYNFNVNVVYSKEDVGEEKAQVSGRAYLNEDGKIAKLVFLKDDGLSIALKQ